MYRDVDLETTAEPIRVLDLLPTQLRAEPIHLALRVASLPSKPQYEALSYTWGASAQEQIAIVNRKYRLAITDNLFNALRRLRRRSSTLILWVDRVCINQADVAERSQQVALMPQIYREAVRVNVWLGEPGFTLPVNF